MKKDLSFVTFIMLVSVIAIALSACGGKNNNNKGHAHHRDDLTAVHSPNFDCFTDGTNCQTFTKLNGIQSFNGFDPSITGSSDWNDTFSGASDNYQNGICSCRPGQELVAYCPKQGETQYSCVNSSYVQPSNKSFVLSWSFKSKNSRSRRVKRHSDRRSHRRAGQGKGYNPRYRPYKRRNRRAANRRNKVNISVMMNTVDHNLYRNNNAGSCQQSISQVCTHSNQCNYMRKGTRAYCSNGNNPQVTGVCVTDIW